MASGEEVHPCCVSNVGDDDSNLRLESLNVLHHLESVSVSLTLEKLYSLTKGPFELSGVTSLV